MGIIQDAVLSIFLTSAIATLLLRLDSVELQYIPLFFALLHVACQWLGPEWSRTRRKRGTCLREHVQAVVASRKDGEYFSVTIGEYFSAGRCRLGVVAVSAGSAWA